MLQDMLKAQKWLKQRVHEIQTRAYAKTVDYWKMLVLFVVNSVKLHLTTLTKFKPPIDLQVIQAESE